MESPSFTTTSPGPPNTARISQDLLTLFGWEIVNHPSPYPYSPDLAPSDFHLFIERVSGRKTSFQRRRSQADGGEVAEWGLAGEDYDTGV